MNLQGRRVDEWGNVIFNSEGLIDLLMKGSDLDQSLISEDTPSLQQFNQLCREFDHPEDRIEVYQKPDLTIVDWDQSRQSEWFIPDQYLQMDIKNWLLEKCQTTDQISRVLEEFEIFEQKGMVKILCLLIYLIDSFRERKVVWGVGRGSSVASYILFLIGIHRVDSLKYDLDFHEFLK